jgi:O-antigen ligase
MKVQGSSGLVILSDRLIVFLLCVVVFFVPFGIWQEAVLLGLTLPKILIPLLFITIILFYPARLKIDVGIFYLLAFIFFIIPSLVIGSEDFLGIFITFLGYIILYLLVYNYFNSLQSIDLFFKSYLSGILVISGCAFLAVVSSVDIGAYFGSDMTEEVFGLKRLLGTELNPNAFAVYYIPAFPLVVHYYLETNSIFRKVLLFLVFVLFSLCLLLTVSRGAMLGALVAIVFLLAYRKRNIWKRCGVMLFIPLMALFTILAPQIVIDYIDLAHAAGDSGSAKSLLADKDLSSQNRVSVLRPYSEVFMKNFVFGVGYGNLTEAVSSYNLEQRTAHNIFLGIAMAYGIGAIVVFIGLIFSALNRVRKRCLKETDSQTRSSLGVILGVVLGLIANGMVHEDYIQIILWLFVTLSFSAAKLGYVSRIEIRQVMQNA